MSRPGPAFSTGPARIQLRRTKGWRKPAGAVVVARPSKWGNPFRVGDEAVAHFAYGSKPIVIWPDLAVVLYRSALDEGALRVSLEDVRRELAGRDLACWCPLDAPCHADVLLELANR